METWDAITARRNVRDYKDQPLPGDVLERILEAAWRAPSARNTQPWDFVVVTDRVGSGHSSVGDQDLARRLLGLPENKLARYIIDFGYPADRPLKPIMNPKRRPFNEVVHQGKW